MAAPPAPVETKTAAAASVSTLTGVITWLLVAYIPAWRTGLPPSLAMFLPFIVASVLGAASGYLAPHTARPAGQLPPPPPPG
jgi:hypothetical protein